MRRIFALTAALALLLTMAGSASATTEMETTPTPRVVVAVIDSAPNPYHEFFHAGGSLYGASAPSSVTPEVLAEFGIDDSHIIRLTRTGDFANDFAADRAQFDAIRSGEPYWFEGTNIIGISLGYADGKRLRPDGSESTHGIGTGAAVLGANPEAIVVMVEDASSDLTKFGASPEGEKWAFNHPAVDLVSTSYGPPGSPPLGYSLVDTYKGVVGNGKLHFGAADNSPALAPIDATAGPWWSIGIAGYGEGSGNGRERLSGSLPDFVGDFTQELPYCRSCVSGKKAVSGTSFATPRSAGTMSKIVLEARRAAGHLGGIATGGTAPSMVRAGETDITNWELRRALEEAAYYPSGESVQSAVDFSWGAITPDPAHNVIGEALGRLGVGGAPTRTKSATTCDWMTANFTARYGYWSAHPRSEGFAKTANPYIAC